MTDRAAPFYCPFCAEEDLRPSAESHGSWRCGSCARIFTVTYIGLDLPTEMPVGPEQEPRS